LTRVDSRKRKSQNDNEFEREFYRVNFKKKFGTEALLDHPVHLAACWRTLQLVVKSGVQSTSAKCLRSNQLILHAQFEVAVIPFMAFSLVAAPWMTLETQGYSPLPFSFPMQECKS